MESSDVNPEAYEASETADGEHAQSYSMDSRRPLSVNADTTKLTLNGTGGLSRSSQNSIRKASNLRTLVIGDDFKFRNVGRGVQYLKDVLQYSHITRVEIPRGENFTYLRNALDASEFQGINVVWPGLGNIPDKVRINSSKVGVLDGAVTQDQVDFIIKHKNIFTKVWIYEDATITGELLEMLVTPMPNALFFILPDGDYKPYDVKITELKGSLIKLEKDGLNIYSKPQ